MQVTIYVEHPVPRDPPAEAPPPPPQPLKLTKKEQKKLRTQRRVAREKARGGSSSAPAQLNLEQWSRCISSHVPPALIIRASPAAGPQERQEMVKQGLLEPPKPKVKVSNLMRVLTDQAAADPTAIEMEARVVTFSASPFPFGHRTAAVHTSHRRCLRQQSLSVRRASDAGLLFSLACVPPCVQVRKQMAERADAHMDRNLARKLTPAEKAEKKARKPLGTPRPRLRSVSSFLMGCSLADCETLTTGHLMLMSFLSQERKLFADTTGEVETICCVYRVEKMTHPQNKYKVCALRFRFERVCADIVSNRTTLHAVHGGFFVHCTHCCNTVPIADARCGGMARSE